MRKDPFERLSDEKSLKMCREVLGLPEIIEKTAQCLRCGAIFVTQFIKPKAAAGKKARERQIQRYCEECHDRRSGSYFHPNGRLC